MRINHNIAALNTYNKLSANSAATQGSLEKLSSGLKINKAGDDAAGLAISEKMRGQIRGLDMASKNAQDGISLIQTAEGALNETHSILQRMRELATQSANDTNTNEDREELQKEVDQLAQEITRISTDTEFNTKKLINGDIDSTGTGTSLTFHIGANQGQNITLDISDMGASALGVEGASATEGINISSQSDANAAISTINAAIGTVSAER
ncbi:flagellin, partial [Terribacillus saccharophilus]|uniref:flagellin N-terminal helical domain-containing protein n=1 Tax=Terribacillus saccharophilus TaxID=361277 RepID=UPI000BA64E2B